ncbi:MAG: BatA domain-containing protein, partial [Bacteroidota bacterium]
MQFKHPEILYALILLLIPIIVHLFQLRRFQKVEFTNVKFLKNVELQTRKSSQIKKWLTLLTRLLIVACAVLAFAQPYISKSDSFNTKNEIVLYLDNSNSMQAQGANGSLLNEAIQDIIGSLDNDEEITLFTNDAVYKNTSIKAISNELIQMKYSVDQLPYQSAYLKGEQLFSKDNSSIKNLILLSDFQQKDNSLIFKNDSTIDLNLVQPKPLNTVNISIDSLYIENNPNNAKELHVLLSSNTTDLNEVSVSLYNDNNLLAKTAVDLSNGSKAIFTLPETETFDGMLSIDDAGLQYDNTFYFNLNTQTKIKVLGINNVNDDFLKKLYTNDEFEYLGYNADALNYN